MQEPSKKSTGRAPVDALNSKVQSLGPGQKSTAARKDVPRDPDGIAAKPPLGGTHPETVVEAGTQAPPVDTHLGRPRMEGPSQGKSKRAAEMRDYMRKRRAAQKEGK